jgi:hypothetical protein
MDTDEFFGLSQRKFTPDEISQIANGVADGVATWTRSLAFDNAMKRLAGRVPMVGLFSLLSDDQKKAALSFDDQA